MLLVRALSSVIVNCALFALLLFPAAGTLHWRHAWVFVAIVFVASVASILGISRNEGLLRERMKPPVQQGQPLADKIVLLAFVTSFFGLLPLIGADVGRWHLFPRPAPWITWVGLALFLFAWVVIYAGLRANAFAAPVVRKQEERGHVLVDTGIYGVVRHPMYAGALPMFIGMPLWLGSYAGLIFGVVPVALIATRVVIEERLLIRELPGYAEYRTRVRYRLLPFVW